VAIRKAIGRLEGPETDRKLRRYGATVFTKVDIGMAGRAIRVLEHASDIHVIKYEEDKEEPGVQRITLRSLSFPRYWEDSEVDLYGDILKGVFVIYHPAGLEDDEGFSSVSEEEEEEGED